MDGVRSLYFECLVGSTATTACMVCGYCFRVKELFMRRISLPLPADTCMVSKVSNTIMIKEGRGKNFVPNYLGIVRVTPIMYTQQLLILRIEEVR